MQAVSEFQARFPQVNIVAEHGDHTQNNDFDIIVTDAGFQHGDFVPVQTFREELLLAFRKGLLPEGEVCAKDLADKAFITMSANYSMHHWTKEICRSLGFEPRIALQSEDPDYVRRCVNLGLGLTFAPEASWRGQFDELGGGLQPGDWHLPPPTDSGAGLCGRLLRNTGTGLLPGDVRPLQGAMLRGTM